MTAYSSDVDMVPTADASPIVEEVDDDEDVVDAHAPKSPSTSALTPPSVPAQQQAQASLPVLELSADSPFDWEAYSSNYTGYTRIQRLIHIAKSSPALRSPAASLAARLVKEHTSDTATYHQALSIRNTDHDSCPLPPTQREKPDDAWVERTDNANRVQLEKLDLELRNYQNNLIKESIRMALKDLADHYKAQGNFVEASKYYQRTREYCATTEHVVEMALNVIELSIHSFAYSMVSTFANKAETVLDFYNPSAAASSSSASAASSATRSTAADARAGAISPPSKGASTSGADAIGALFRAGGSAGPSAARGGVATAGTAAASTSTGTRGDAAQARLKKQVAKVRAKIQVASGIAALGMGQYDRAARHFLAGDAQYADGHTDIASAGDVALYGVICALATFPRPALKSEVVDCLQFRGFMDHEPHVREMLDAFWNCDYKRVLHGLETHKNRHLVDIHLSTHLAHLTTLITQQSLAQLLSPFSDVSISSVTSAFGWSDAQTTEQILSLIEDGTVDAKIDLIEGVVYANEHSARQELFHKTLETGRERSKGAERTLFKMDLIRNGLVHRDDVAGRERDVL